MRAHLGAKDLRMRRISFGAKNICDRKKHPLIYGSLLLLLYCAPCPIFFTQNMIKGNVEDSGNNGIFCRVFDSSLKGPKLFTVSNVTWQYCSRMIRQLLDCSGKKDLFLSSVKAKPSTTWMTRFYNQDY